MFRKAWLALSSVARSDARPPLRVSTTADFDVAPSAPTTPGLAEVTGIYQDGKGTYLPENAVEFFHGDLRIAPLCSARRSLRVLLPAAARARLRGPMEDCRGTGGLLKIPGLLDAQTGILGEPSPPPDYPKGASVFYYFVVDSSGDGRFALSNNDAYHLVWQCGIHLNRREHPEWTVYELTTDPTLHDAELIRDSDAGGVSEGAFSVPLRLTVKRWRGEVRS